MSCRINRFTASVLLTDSHRRACDHGHKPRSGRGDKAGTFQTGSVLQDKRIPYKAASAQRPQAGYTAMANSILSDLCDRYNMEPKRFSDEALKIITVYDWPGQRKGT